LDNDPLFLYHRWRANLRVLDVEEIKSVPYTPISHPFVERLIGTVRRELLDQTFFWNQFDLQRKLDSFKQYYNDARVHSSLKILTPLKSRPRFCRPTQILKILAGSGIATGSFRPRLPPDLAFRQGQDCD
jgi:transposase InsO family protein